MKKKTFTTFDIAGMLDVYPTTVADWIDNGKLKAFTTPGGHRRVNSEDLLEFLKKYNMPIPAEMVSSENTEKKKILIVDDDPKFVKSIEKVLKKKNKKYEVSTAVLATYHIRSKISQDESNK